MKNWEQLKNKTTTQSGSVISMFEQEEIRHGKEGMSIEDIAATMLQYEEKRSAMNTRKWRNYPKIPTDLQSLFYENEKYRKTLNDKRFLTGDCYEKNQRVTIFCSDNQLKMLGKCSKIGVDGTFKSCPKLYAQLYILMAWFKGVIMPAAFVLLGGKKQKHIFV